MNFKSFTQSGLEARKTLAKGFSLGPGNRLVTGFERAEMFIGSEKKVKGEK